MWGLRRGPRSGHQHAAIDGQGLAGDVGRAGRRQEQHRLGHVLRAAQPPGRDLLQQRRLLRLSGSARVMSVSMKPGATALTVMLREASSRARTWSGR